LEEIQREIERGQKDLNVYKFMKKVHKSENVHVGVQGRAREV